MDPVALDILDKCNAIQVLVPFLVRESGLSTDNSATPAKRPSRSVMPQPAFSLTDLHPKDVQNHVLHALFNLCRVNKQRQQAAAVAGVIPALQQVVQDKSSVLKASIESIIFWLLYAVSRTSADVCITYTVRYGSCDSENSQPTLGT
jgi:hypothetical protein